MNSPPDLRLAELFVRYWDSTLTPAEAEELEQRLATDPAARESFQAFTLQAVAAADLRAAQRVAEPSATQPLPAEQPASEPRSEPRTPTQVASRRWSRRRVLGLLGGGLAASVGAVALGRWLWPEPVRPSQPEKVVRLGAIRGTVTLRAADGSALPTDGPVPPGSTVATSGPGASAVLFYPNGTNVALTEDSTVTLGSDREHLRLERGVVAADVRPPLVGGLPLTLATAETVLTGNAGVIMTLYQAATVTEVGVQRGSVNVSAPGGQSLGEVRDGELLTVRAGGDCQKQPIRDTAESYSLDLTRALAPGWEVGQLVPGGGERSLLVPEFWPDPFYKGRKMYQIRSNKQWARGFFQLKGDSVVTVRYRLTKAEKGTGQVCFCVRRPDVRSPDTGMLEWNGEYGSPEHPVDADGWRTLTVAAGNMLANDYAPKFGELWIGFLFIFNTYTADLGLQVAEFRVSPASAD